MKPTAFLRNFVLLAGSSLLTVSVASAQSTLYWDGGTTNIGTDGNGASAGGAGTWNTSLTNWDAGASPHVAWDNTAPFDTAVLGGTAGTVTLGTSVSADTININTAGYAISPSATNQLTVSTINVAGGGTSSFGAAGTVNIGGSLLTVTTATAADRFSFAQEGSTNSVRITLNESVSAGTSISGPGYVNFRLVANNTTGGISISGGATVLLNNTIADSLGTNNLTINGGQVSTYTSTAITRALGVGASQIQITGGVSGFDTTGTVTFNNSAATEVVWGSGTFNPDTFVLSSSTLANNTNLSGADRTVQVRSGTTGTMSGVIRNTTGTAGLIKEGAGTLVLSNAANSFNGAVTINGGTLSVGTLANGGSNSGLGASSNAASNLLLGNNATFRYAGAAVSTNRSFTINGTAVGHGASLDASGTGAVNFTNTASPAYGTVDQSRTLTLTGTNTGNNILAANIANNGTGAVSLSKTGAGLWVLSGTNTYTGATTLTAGTLSVGASANLGNAASNLIFNGGTLQITGTGLTNFASLGRTVSFNSGVNVGLDIVDAGNVFALDQSFDIGKGGLTKTGAGTLRFDDGVSITAGALNLSGGTFAVNRSTDTTLGTQLPALIGGAGGVLSNIGSGAVVINNALALQNTALGTAGGGTFSLSGVTTPVIGGLSGATGDLATVISSGYDSVTNLTLNPQAGNTFTYGGVIANGAAGMTLTKTGAGTQILQGASTYTGATTINAGTLALSGASGALASTTINLNGGGLTLDNTTNSGNRVSDSATVNVLGNSALTFSNPGAASTNYSETIDTLSLQSGFLTYTGSRAATGQTSNVLFNTLSRSGASNTSTVNFAGTSLGADTRNTITFGAGVTNGVELGPWAVVNGADFATYDATLGIKATANTTLAATSNNAATNWKMTGGSITITGGTNPSYKTLLVSDTTARTLTTTGNTVSVGGISTTGQTHIISGTGTVQALTAGDALYINVGANALTFSSAIQNVGAGATASALVKSGTGTLTLGSTSNTYSGGTVINSGILSVTADTNLGATSGGITFNGGQLTVASSNLSTNRTVTVNSGGGAIAVNGNNNFTISSSGTLTGSGTLTKVAVGGSGGQTINLNGNNSGFTGAIFIDNSNANGPSTIGLDNLADTAGSGNLISGTGTSSTTFSITGSTALTLTNRRIQMDGTSMTLTNGSATANTGVWTINSDLINTVSANKTLTLTVRGGSTNTFAGSIGDAIGGGTLSITKGVSGGTGNGIWDLSSPNNTFTGTITTGNGTLSLKSFGPTGGLIQIGGNGSNVPTLTYTGAALSTSRQVMIGYSGNASGGVLNNNGTGALTFTASTFSADPGGNQGTRTMTLGGTFSGGDNEIQGAIVKGAGTDNLAITKANDASTWVLSGTNTYGGATTISGGTLAGIGSNAFGSTSGISIAAAGTLSLRGNTNTSFQKNSDSSLYTVNNTASGATINVDRVSGTGAATMTVGNLTTSSTAATWALNFTGANGAGLSAGTLTTPTAASASHTINNNITGGGSLTLGSIAAGGTGATATLIFNGSGDTTVSGAITKAATTLALTKNGTGTLALEGASAHNGATNVNDGTLLVNGSTVAGSTVSVAAGAILGGTGTIGGAVNVTGSLSPGASIETLGTGTLSFSNGSTLVHELDSSVATSVGSDLLKVTGNLNLAGTVGLSMADIASTDVAFSVNDIFSLINYTGTWNGGLFDYGGNELADEEEFVFGFNTWRISYDDATGGLNYAGEYAGGSDSFVNLTVVNVIPEPRAALLGALGALMLLRRRR